MLHQIHPRLDNTSRLPTSTEAEKNPKNIAGKILQKEFEEGKFKF